MYLFTVIALVCSLGSAYAYADTYSNQMQCLQSYYTKSYMQALPFCLDAANEGNSQAQYVLGIMYSDGLGVKKATDKAIMWLQKAAKQAHAAASYKLKRLQQEVRSNTDITNKYLKLSQQEINLEKHLQSKKAKKKRQNSFPQHKSNRNQTRTDAKRTTHSVTYDFETPAAASAQQSQPAALQPAAPPADAALLQHYMDASKRGNAHARFMLGLFYREGRGTQKDPLMALTLIKQAATQDLPQAQLTLGLLYTHGYAGNAPDTEKAMPWLRKAAKHGLAEAEYSLGLLYANNNAAKALKWWRKAAHHGYAKAQHNLAVMYLNGVSIGKNKAKAMQWFVAEAEHGDPQTQFNMGRLFSEGKWFHPSGEEAATWFYRAGETWLDQQQPKKATMAVANIRQLASVRHLSIPNQFLAQVLNRKIEEAGTQKSSFQ